MKKIILLFLLFLNFSILFAKNSIFIHKDIETNVKLIKEELQYEVELINTGTTVAKHLEHLLIKQDLQNTQKKDNEVVFLTKPEPYFKELAKNILNFDIIIK